MDTVVKKDEILNVAHVVANHDGWELALRQRYVPALLKKDRRPVAIVPGYGMNSKIFGYHPNSFSLEEYVASRGFEVWSMDLREQGRSRRLDPSRKPRPFYLRDLALTDLPACLGYIAGHTLSLSKAGTVDCLGCSLGGSILFAYIALTPKHRVGALAALGAPLRWVEVHPFIKFAFGSPFVMERLPFVKSREIAAFILPRVTKVPRLLDIYIHGDHSDLGAAKKLVESVENPVRWINAEICRWIKARDLYIDGVNVYEGMRSFSNPIMALIANADGIVPPATALTVLDAVRSKSKCSIVVGTDTLRFAHADLYVSNHATGMVFKPIAEWLEKNYQ